jgi:hypothetical protein
VIVGIRRGLFVRVLQIVERVRVGLISGGHLLCFECHLNSVFVLTNRLTGGKNRKGMKTHVFGNCIVLEGHDCVEPEFLKRYVQAGN